MSDNGAAPKKTLVQKLAEVMGEVERVAKRGRNEFHKYDYATEADIMAAVREHMAARSLMLVPSVEEITWRGEFNCLLKVRFTVYDGENPVYVPAGPERVYDSMSFVVYGEGQDKGDKATYKAMTGANKYALLKLFLIPTGNDPEADDAVDRASSKNWGKPKKETSQEALDKAPYRDREVAKVDKETGELVAELFGGNTYEEPDPFAPLEPGEATMMQRRKLLGSIRAQFEKSSATPATRTKLWAIFCGAGTPKMQGDPASMVKLLTFMQDCHTKGIDLNEADAAA